MTCSWLSSLNLFITCSRLVHCLSRNCLTCVWLIQGLFITCSCPKWLYRFQIRWSSRLNNLTFYHNHLIKKPFCYLHFFWAQHLCGPKMFLDPKCFWTQIVFRTKNFLDLQFFGTKIFLTAIFFWPIVLFWTNYLSYKPDIKLFNSYIYAPAI